MMFQTASILLPLLINIVVGSVSKGDVVNDINPPFLTIEHLGSLSPTSYQYEGNRPIASILHGKNKEQTLRKINDNLDTKRHKDRSIFIENDLKKIDEDKAVKEGKDISDLLPTDSVRDTRKERKFTDLPISKRQRARDKIEHTKNSYQLKGYLKGNKSSDVISNVRLRRASANLLKLLKIFVKTPTDIIEETPKVTTRQNSSQEEIRDDTEGKNGKVRKHINVKEGQYINENEKQFINDLLNKLDEIIKKLDSKIPVDNISETKNDSGFILVKMPLIFNDVSRKTRRSKREVTQKYQKMKLEIVNDTVSVNNTEKSNNTIDFRKTFHKNSNNTVDLGKTYLEEINNANNLRNSYHDKNDNIKFNKTYQENSKSLRKSHHTNISENVAVISKIDSAFNDVQKQIAPIKSMKEHFASDKTYKVGQIIANLETLEFTLKKLITKFKTSKNFSDVSAQKVLNRVEISKTVVFNLMEFLRLYTESPG